MSDLGPARHLPPLPSSLMPCVADSFALAPCRPESPGEAQVIVNKRDFGLQALGNVQAASFVTRRSRVLGRRRGAAFLDRLSRNPSPWRACPRTTGTFVWSSVEPPPSAISVFISLMLDSRSAMAMSWSLRATFCALLGALVVRCRCRLRGEHHGDGERRGLISACRRQARLNGSR